jgi:hypothetical protein
MGQPALFTIICGAEPGRSVREVPGAFVVLSNNFDFWERKDHPSAT